MAMNRILQEIIIDEKFRNLLPPLDKETFAWLEESLLEYGCQNPLVLWNGILIDGHNRYEIIKKHDLPFQTIDMEFDTREDALIWIISTQISRRNLTPIQLSHFRGLHYNADKRKPGTSSNQYSESFAGAQNGHQQKSTATRLAEHYNVSRNTIRRDAQLSEAIIAIGEKSPEAKRKILSGQAKISRARLQELSSGTDADIIETAEKIKAGTHERRMPRMPSQKENELHPDSSSYEQLTLENFINKISEDIDANTRNIAKTSDTVKSKAAIRSLIDKLEDIYRSI